MKKVIEPCRLFWYEPGVYETPAIRLKKSDGWNPNKKVTVTIEQNEDETQPLIEIYPER